MSRQGGFTLVETLIALVLMSLLMLALFGGFRAGVASWKGAEAQVAASETQLQLSRMLQRHMRQLLKTPSEHGTGGRQQPGLLFTGKPGLIRYVAPLALSTDNSLYSIELSAGAGESGGLWIRFVPYDEQEDVLEALEGSEYLLISAEAGVQFDYYLNEEWVDELEEDVFPNLLRIHLSTPQRTWSSMVYAIAPF